MSNTVRRKNYKRIRQKSTVFRVMCKLSLETDIVRRVNGRSKNNHTLHQSVLRGTEDALVIAGVAK